MQGVHSSVMAFVVLDEGDVPTSWSLRWLSFEGGVTCTLGGLLLCRLRRLPPFWFPSPGVLAAASAGALLAGVGGGVGVRGAIRGCVVAPWLRP